MKGQLYQEGTFLTNVNIVNVNHPRKVGRVLPGEIQFEVSSYIGTDHPPLTIEFDEYQYKLEITQINGFNMKALVVGMLY